MSCIDWLAEKNHHRLDSLILVGWSMGSAAVIEVWSLRVFGIQPSGMCVFVYRCHCVKINHT